MVHLKWIPIFFSCFFFFKLIWPCEMICLGNYSMKRFVCAFFFYFISRRWSRKVILKGVSTCLVKFNETNRSADVECVLINSSKVHCVLQARRWLSASRSCCLWLCSCWSSWSSSLLPPARCLSSGSTCSSPWCLSLPPSSSPSLSSTPTTAPQAPTRCQSGFAK